MCSILRYLCREDSRKNLHCRTFASEVLYNLSASRNISKGLSAFGITDDAQSLLCIVRTPTKSRLDAVRTLIDGDEEGNIEAGLSAVANTVRIRESYGVQDAESEVSDLPLSIATRISVRDVK